MDIEGNELDTLSASIETIINSNYPPILFECNGNNHELFNFLSSTIGYNIININGYPNMFLAVK